MTIGREVPECLKGWKLEQDELLQKIEDELQTKATQELADWRKQYEEQLEKKDRPEQVSTELVEGQVEEEAAKSRCVRNDVKLSQVPHRGGKSSIVNLGGLWDFPHPLVFKTEHTD